MKKILLAAITMGLTASVFAQGTIDFANVSGTGTSGRIMTLSNGIPVLAANGTYSVGLYWGVLGSTEAQLTLILQGKGNFSAGRFTLGNAVTGAATAPGANATFEVKAWDGPTTSYEAAVAAGTGGVGTSGLFQNPTGGGGSPPGLPAEINGWTGNIIITPIPEPATIALCGLGAASLLLFRRRK